MALTDKLTAVANPIRTLSGTTDPMTLTAMANHVTEANEKVETQAGLIAQIAIALGNVDVTTESHELVTVYQNCSNVLAACTAFEAYVGADDQIVLFIREDFASRPTADTPSNTGLFFLWFSSLFNEGSGPRHVWARWRSNEISTNYITTADYDYIVPAETVFRKVVVR